MTPERLRKRPALRVGALDGCDLAGEREVVEAGEDDLQDPGAGGRVDVVGADDLGDDLESGAIAAGQRRPRLAEQLLDLAPALGDLRLGVAEGAAVAGQDEADVERLDLVEAGEEFADRVRGVAVVEEENGAAE